MKWIKANERLPENRKCWYVFRQSNNTRSAQTAWLEHAGNNIEGFFKLPLTNLEWLDESESTPTTTVGGSEALFRWVELKDRKPPQEVELFFDGGEDPPSFGRFRTIGKFDYVVVMDSSGEENLYSSSEYERWLEPIPAGAAHAQQLPSPITVDIVEALEKANPYERSVTQVSHYTTWEKCCAKLRELIASQPPAPSVQGLIDVLQKIADKNNFNSGVSFALVQSWASEALKAYQIPSNIEGQEERKHELENWEEAWDKASEHIDDDLSSLEMVAGRSVIKHHDFLNLSKSYALIKK